MVTHPEIQAKAQAEIDRVVGVDRLPGFEDRQSLPYVDAIYREVLRWKPPDPMGIAHRAEKDDTYKGYFIPEGSPLYIYDRVVALFLIHLCRDSRQRKYMVSPFELSGLKLTA